MDVRFPAHTPYERTTPATPELTPVNESVHADLSPGITGSRRRIAQVTVIAGPDRDPAMNRELFQQPIESPDDSEVDGSIVLKANSQVETLLPGFDLFGRPILVVVELRAQDQVPNHKVVLKQGIPGNITPVMRIVRTANKPCFGIKIRLNFVISRSQGQFIITPCGFELPCLIAAREARGVAPQNERIELQTLIELEMCIDAIDTVVVPRHRRLAVGHQTTDP